MYWNILCQGDIKLRLLSIHIYIFSVILSYDLFYPQLLNDKYFYLLQKILTPFDGYKYAYQMVVIIWFTYITYSIKNKSFLCS